MKIKRWGALLLAAAMLTLCLTGCLGNFYEIAGTIDGREISSGLYLAKQFSAYNQAKSEVEDTSADVLKQEVEGQSAEDWIAAKTEELLRKYVCVERLCAEREIVLSDENSSYMDQMAQYWDMYADLYTENGISTDTLRHDMVNALLEEQLFGALYGEGGELAPSDDQLKEEYGAQNAHVRYISVQKDNAPEEINKNAEILPIAEEMFASLQEGTDMETVAEEGLPQVYEILGNDFTDTTVEENIMTAYINYEEESDIYTPEFLAELKEKAVGDIGMYEMDYSVMLYEVIPTFETEEEFAETRDTALDSLYYDVYQEHLASIYNEYPVEWVTGARWFFRPSKIVEE